MAISNELVVGLVPTFLTFVFTPVTALVAATGSAGGTNEFADTITISSTSAVFVAGKVPTCTGGVTALAQSATDLRLTLTSDIAASTATTIKCDGTTSYAGLTSTGATVVDSSANKDAVFTITNSLAGHYLFSVTTAGTGYVAGDTIVVKGSLLGGADATNDATLTVIGAAGIGASAAEVLSTATPPVNVMIMGAPVASATAGAFAVNPAAGTIPFTMVTTKDTLKTGDAIASATYTTRVATASSFASVAISNELVVGLVPTFLTFVFTPVIALVAATGSAGGTNEFADTITMSSTSAVFVAGKVPTCTGGVTALAQSATDLRLTVTSDIAASTATTIKCDGTTSYAGLTSTGATVVDSSANKDAVFTITNSLAGHYLFSVTTAGTGYVAGDTIVVKGTLLGGADATNDATLTVIGAAGIGASAAEVLSTATPPVNVMIMGAPVASATAGAFAVNPAAGTIPFTMVTTKDTLKTGDAIASATYTTRVATASSFASVAISNELVVGLVPTFLTFVFTPVIALVAATGSAGGTNEFADTITMSSTSAVFVAGKVPTCTGGVTALAQSATDLRLTLTSDIAASTATTIKCDGTTSYAGLTSTGATVVDSSANKDAVFTITNSLAGHYLFSVTTAGTGYVAGDTIVVKGSLLGGLDGTNDATLTVIGAAGIGASAAEVLSTATPPVNVMIMGAPVASATAGAFAVNPAAGTIPFTMVTTKDTLKTGDAIASATYTTRVATASSFASVAISNELVVGLVPTFLTFVFTPVTALVAATGSAGGTNEFADTITMSSTSAVFVAGKVPTCTGGVTALAQSATDLRLTLTSDIAASTATTIKCDGTTSYAGLTSTGATVVDSSANKDAVFTITNSLAGHYLFSVTTAGTGYVAGDTIVVKGSLLGGADTTNDATLTVIGAAGIGASAAEVLSTATPPVNVMIMGTPVASATAGAFAVNPAAGTIPFTMVTTKDTLKTGDAIASATYTTRVATASSFASVAISNELVVGLVPTFLTFVFTPVTALVAATGSAGGTNEFADTITMSSTSAVFVAGKVPTCTGGVTALAQSATDLRLTVTSDIAASTATTIKCDGTTSYAGLTSTGATVVDSSANKDAVFTITNSLAGHYLFSVTTAGTGYVAGDTIVVKGTLLGGADTTNDATLTVIGAAGIGASAAEALSTATPPANVMIMGTPVASATAGAFAVNPAAGTIPFTMVTTKDTLNDGRCNCERYLHNSRSNSIVIRICGHLKRTRRRPRPHILLPSSSPP